MPVVTAFLRDLVRKTAAREETLADVPPGIDLPQDMAIPVVPLVGAPHGEGEGDDAGAAVPMVEAIEAPRGSASHGSAPRDSAPPAAEAGPVILPVVLPIVAPHAAGGAVAAVPLVGVIETPRNSVPRDSVPPAEAVRPVVLPDVLPVVVPHAAGEGNGVGAVVPLVGAIDAPHDSAPRVSAPPADEVEHANAAIPSLEETAQGVPSVELGHLALSPVVEPDAEGGRDSAVAEVPPAANQAPADSGPPAAAPLEQAEAADANMACLEEIKERVDLLFRPLPASPAEVLANHMADTLRALGCPPPSAASLLEGQTYRGGGGSGSDGSGSIGDSSDGKGSVGSVSGSGGGGGDGGDGGGDGGDGGGGRTEAGSASLGVPPGVTGLKPRRPLMAGFRPFWTPECFSLKRFW